MKQLPQNASINSWSQYDPSPVGRTRTIEHELTCEPIGRDGLGDKIPHNQNLEK